LSTETTLSKFIFDRDERLGTNKLSSNLEIRMLGNKFMDEAVRLKYFYNFEFMGLPIIQFPQDCMALQEIIWQTKPDVIIETGLAWGGSHVMYANYLNSLGPTVNGIHRRVISVEQHILDHVVESIEERYVYFPWVKPSFIEGDSTKIPKSQLEMSDKVMVCLDSAHWYEHVRNEIEMYANLVSIGCYLVVFDTFVHNRNPILYKDHSCQPGNDPWKAVENFTNYDDRFVIDTEIDRKLLISSNYNGYLKRIK
jgi:cephalosporin hydroxylase